MLVTRVWQKWRTELTETFKKLIKVGAIVQMNHQTADHASRPDKVLFFADSHFLKKRRHKIGTLPFLNSHKKSTFIYIF